MYKTTFKYCKMEYDFNRKEALASSEYLNILRHLTNASSDMWPVDVKDKTRKGTYAVNNPWQCSICGAHFRPFGPLSVREVRRYAVCTRCHGHVCRATCGQWLQGDWFCKQCIQATGVKQSWFKGILTALQPNAVTVRMSKGQASETGTDVKGVTDGQNEDKEVVRDFIERLVGAMLGADLDETSVGRLYADSEYDAMFDRYHGDISTALTELGSALHISIANLPVTGQTPCTAHASLKHIIRRVLRDASNMAILKDPQTEPESADTTSNRTYEDLLATAILNKVIDNYQTDLRRSSSGSSASRKSSSSKKHKNKRHNEERWQKCEHPDLDTTSVSSVEEWCRSESSCGSKYVDHMSFTIKQSIEEITTSDDEASNNQYMHSCNLSRNSNRNSDKEDSSRREDWQDNWLFSRKGKGSPKPVPVPMLVPNPSTEFRALIGDRDAEDTSDLSETGSDIEETKSVHDIKTILVDSRTVIGGKNLIEQIDTEIFEPDAKKEVIEVKENGLCNGETKQKEVLANGVDEVDDADDDIVSEAKNGTLIHETVYVESDSLGSNTEKDMEYTERYASIPRQIAKNKSPVPSPRTSKDSINDQQREELVMSAQSSAGSSDEENPPSSVTGSYSEKEKEKWRNPIALANNPYSKENLDKRLQNKSKINENYSFGRDYYIREAKKASGGRHKVVNNDSWTERSDQNSDQDEPMSPISENSFDRSLDLEQHIYTAVPVSITEEPEVTKELEDGDQFDCDETVPRSRPVSLALSTDSEDVDVRRVYNVETGKLYKYRSKNITEEVIKQSKSPEGIKYIVQADELSVSSNLVENKFDENHNETQQTQEKEPIMSISKINHLISPAIEVINKDETTEMDAEVTGKDVKPRTSVKEYEIVEKHEPIQTIPMRDISKKYLQSLVKNNNAALKIEMINSYATPPISLQEFNQESTTNKEHVNGTTNNITADDTVDSINDLITTPPVSLEEYTVDETGNHIDLSDLNNYPKSCIDLRFINQNGNFSVSQEETLAVKQLLDECTKSTPNLSEERLYHSEDNDEDYCSKPMRTIDQEDLENLPLPSVRNLKKLFDNENKLQKSTIVRTKSQLSTRPEINVNKQQIHSLTARSLPQGVRQELKKTSDEIIVDKNGISKGESEESEASDKDELEIIPIPACKSKIQFFEQLKSSKA